ncbi:hypothetical protein I203_101456 [Kwoniella mangroviensis CBS 8507]|uniref:uncharacterized protein n=1 Tax=Kwoniella mangroviensis CBS 8507 TaxID=1296122 RepID=UPI00080CE686|nr:uncharacterized protein I203_05509 [Kwoniella mangroviensis CBS 8507]OCF65263.1 hypothetical protein I203_05509 [Kwoniella mangroviensis CBS 8507]
MKSLFSRFKGGPSDSRSSSRANSSASTNKEREKENLSSPSDPKSKSSSSTNKQLKKVLSRNHLSEKPTSSSSASSPDPPPRTLTPIGNQHSSSSPNLTYDDPRPHSITGSAELLSPVVGLWDEPRGENRNRHGTISASGDIHDRPGGKKVTFRSPAPTPTTSVVLDQATKIDFERRGSSSSIAGGTSPSKRASTSALKPPSASQTDRPGTSQSTNSTNKRPRPTSRQTSPFLPSLVIRPTAFRKASLPPLGFNTHGNGTTSSSPTKSSTTILSPTPSDASTGAMSNMSYLPQPNSWSEMAEDDLIANLGPKERTRQEVLWEIVSSEDRYVQDLIKFNETFCKSLLPLSANSPHLDLYDPTPSIITRTMSPSSPALSGNESFVNLPIAARYSSTTPRYSGERYPSDSSTSTAPPMTPNDESIARGNLNLNLNGPPPSSAARMNAYNILTNGRPNTGLGLTNKASISSLNGKKGHHNSLPPPSSSRQHSNSSQSDLKTNDNRLSYHPGIHNKLHKASSRISSGGSIGPSSATASGTHVKLPEDLEKVLTVLSGGILDGHIKLSNALKKRYENQYPLVRSLADVFTAHSYILREYSTYVLHLERALSQVDESLSRFSDISGGSGTTRSKRNSKRLEESDIGILSRRLMGLEELASEKGEAGLVISLSKPFQRLLKYPLLFQNLLFNTDPSLKEYEATLSMVDQVEEIVRSIEDQKGDEEERERTRDVWARIDGLERDKVIMAPKPNRMLIGETQLPVPEGSHLKVQKDIPTSVKGKKSFKRLSDILKGGGDSDLWVVRFSDVSLLCEKTGVTHLPIASFKKATKSDSSNDLSGKKHATMGKRSASVRARNLYRFVKVHEWHLKSRPSTDGLLDMNDISASRQRLSEVPRSPPVSKYPTLPSIAGTPHATPTKVPLKTVDGSANPSPTKSFRSRKGTGNGNGLDDDTMSVISDGISEMSFAFKDGDQVKPNLKAKPKTRQSLPPTSASTSATKPGRNIGSVGRRTTSQPGLTRRLSGGHVGGQAANAKFANRLRSPDLNHNHHHHAASDTEGPPVVGDRSASAAGKARRSLPPTSGTTMSGGLRPLHTAGIASATASRPAWNSGLSTTSTTRRASTPASQVGSVRGTRLSQMNNDNRSGSEGRRIPIGRSSMTGTSNSNINVNKTALGRTVTTSSTKVADEDNDNGNNDMQDNGEIRKMPSKEDSVVGLWRAFDESKSEGPPTSSGVGLGLGMDSAEGKSISSVRRGGTRGTGVPSRGSVSSLRGVTSTPRGSGLRGGSPATGLRGGAAGGTTPTSVVGSGRLTGKAATVGRGGNLVSSRKRDLGGKI